MYITYKDLVFQISEKITELSKLQTEILLSKDLNDEATEDDKDEVYKK